MIITVCYRAVSEDILIRDFEIQEYIRLARKMYSPILYTLWIR